MDIKKSLKDVIVLFAICAVFATVLAAVNSVTAPIIAEQLAGAANEAYMTVLPGAVDFEDVDLSGYTFPATVKEAKRETSGKGFAVKLEVTGYKPGMVLIVGVDTNGVVTGSTCIASNETWGLESVLGGEVVGKDINTIADVRAGATSLTVNGYREAVKVAINVATVLGGGSGDFRTEEEILNDNLNAALSTEKKSFEKVFITEVVSVDKIYSETEGLGYVCVVGDYFVGVNADGVVNVVDAEGNVVTDGVDEAKAKAEAAVTAISSTELTEITLTNEYKKLFKSCGNNAYAVVTRLQKTTTGNYIVDLETDGFGVLGDDHGYIPGSGEKIKIQVSISADGIILDSQTISHGETDGYGSLDLEDGKYNSEFIGKDDTGANNVDIIATHTRTTAAYKYAVLLAFEIVTAIEGGAN